MSRIGWGLFLLALCSSARATTIEWTLENITFGDGGTATGSFYFDADDGPNGTFSNFDISTQGGSSGIGPNMYTFLIPPTATFFFHVVPTFAVNLTNDPMLTIDFTPNGLTDAGGSVQVLEAEEQICANADCTAVFGGPARIGGFGGELIGSPVPEPTSLALLTVGVCGLFWFRKRHAPNGNWYTPKFLLYQRTKHGG
jgi:hypothetical protein